MRHGLAFLPSILKCNMSNTRHISDCGRSIQICLCLSVVSSGFQFQEPVKSSTACNMLKSRFTWSFLCDLKCRQRIADGEYYDIWQFRKKTHPNVNSIVSLRRQDSEYSNDQGWTTATLVLKSFHCFENDRQCTMVREFRESALILTQPCFERGATRLWVVLWMTSLCRTRVRALNLLGHPNTAKLAAFLGGTCQSLSLYQTLESVAKTHIHGCLWLYMAA